MNNGWDLHTSVTLRQVIVCSDGNWSASPDVYVKYMIYRVLGYPGNLSSHEYASHSTEL